MQFTTRNCYHLKLRGVTRTKHVTIANANANALASHIHFYLLQAHRPGQQARNGEGTHQDGDAEARTNIQTAGKPCYRNCLLTVVSVLRLQHAEIVQWSLLQVHELHRVYQVQKQLMMEITKTNNCRNLVPEMQTKPTVNLSNQQWCGSSGKTEATLVEDFNLELTLATGTGRRKQKPSNSDSEATMSSSTSAESELGRRFMPKSNVTTLRFENESTRHDNQIMQPPWRYQGLSLKMA